MSCWLREIVGLGQYCRSFEGERVDGAVLMLLGKAELVELGVLSPLHSARILGKVSSASVSCQKCSTSRLTFVVTITQFVVLVSNFVHLRLTTYPICVVLGVLQRRLGS